MVMFIYYELENRGDERISLSQESGGGQEARKDKTSVESWEKRKKKEGRGKSAAPVGVRNRPWTKKRRSCRKVRQQKKKREHQLDSDPWLIKNLVETANQIVEVWGIPEWENVIEGPLEGGSHQRMHGFQRAKVSSAMMMGGAQKHRLRVRYKQKSIIFGRPLCNCCVGNREGEKGRGEGEETNPLQWGLKTRDLRPLIWGLQNTKNRPSSVRKGWKVLMSIQGFPVSGSKEVHGLESTSPSICTRSLAKSSNFKTSK